ncbi:unnamed protein product [Moneuplotes crassus]|uniref:Uncharacterized protein n=1 Tax=Euplotes crassus TaxID=5936 RepID=A0AAD1Y7X5_EUPCR|nr:unnamed protein product [Moneuplotes crassus]
MGSSQSLEIRPKSVLEQVKINLGERMENAYNQASQHHRSPQRPFHKESAQQVQKACPVESVYIDLSEEKDSETKHSIRQALISHSRRKKIIKSDKLVLEDFEVRRCIGIGGFSTVIEVMKKDTKKLYAMKIIQKSMIEKKSKIKQIMAERNILKMVDHPFIINLHWAFKSKDYLHMVLDYCSGGEFFYHLSRNGRLDEEIAKFYFSEVLLALEYLHNNGIIYRDLKPENILLDAEGHVVLTDFGLSKTNFSRKTLSHSFCGSPEYMSPEMLEEVGHGFAMDIYSLGALLYEFLTGLPPHYSQDRDELFYNICHEDIPYPDYLSEKAKDLLQKLLKRNPLERLGTIDGIGVIKFHPFCETVDFEALVERRYVPPFIPDDTQFYFDTDYVKKQIGENPQNYFPIDDFLKNTEHQPKVIKNNMRESQVENEQRVFSEEIYCEKQSGNINMSLQESTYNGYSFYKPASETSESCDCSLISTQYKISEKVNDLNTSKNTKETQFELLKEDILSGERKFTSSQISSNVFEINDPKNNPLCVSSAVEEITERANVSPEPEVHKPHVGNAHKTKRERNLEDFWMDKSESQSMDIESNFIDEFLESFDTKLNNFDEKSYFNDVEEHKENHDVKLKNYTSYLSSKMETYSSFNNKKASINFTQKEPKALTSIKPPQKKEQVSPNGTRTQKKPQRKLHQIANNQKAERSVVNFHSLRKPSKNGNLKKKYASAKVSCERQPKKSKTFKKQKVSLLGKRSKDARQNDFQSSLRRGTSKLPQKSGHINHSSISYLHLQKFSSRDTSPIAAKNNNRTKSQIGDELKITEKLTQEITLDNQKCCGLENTQHPTLTRYCSTLIPKRSRRSLRGTTNRSKDPKFMAEVDGVKQKATNIHPQSCNKSLGGEVRGSNPTKKIDNVKLSFESLDKSNNMIELIQSKMSQNSPFNHCSSIKSETFVSPIHLNKQLTHDKAKIKKLKNSEVGSYVPLRTINNRRGSKTPMIGLKVSHSSAERPGDYRRKDSFLTSTLRPANLNQENKIDSDLSPRENEKLDKSRNNMMKYSTYSEQASIAKLNRMNFKHQEDSHSFASRLNMRSEKSHFLCDKIGENISNHSSSFINQNIDSKYGRYTSSRNHEARSKPRFEVLQRKSALNGSNSTKLLDNFTSSSHSKKQRNAASRKKISYISKRNNPLTKIQSSKDSKPYIYAVRNINLQESTKSSTNPSFKHAKESLNTLIDETKLSSCHSKASFSSSHSKILAKRIKTHYPKPSGIGNYKKRQIHY